MTTSSGSALSLGVLSFSGMLLLSSSAPIAFVAFFLAAAIEGTVYRQNISQALKNLNDQEEAITLTIAKRELNKAKLFTNNIFIKDYLDQKKYLHRLEESKNKVSSGNRKIANQEIEIVNRRLKDMQHAFLKGLRKESIQSLNGLPALLNLLDNYQFESKEDIAKEISKKKKYMRLSLFIALGSGLCAGLVTIASLATFFSTIGLVGGLALATGIPIVGFAAVGYMLIMYHTLADMIQNETVKKWINKLQTIIHTPKQERNAHYYLALTGLVLLSALSIFATLTTAGTWWYLAKAGAQLIKFLPKIAASTISIATWTFTLVPILLFNFVNALESLGKIPGLIHHALHGNAHELKGTWKNENVLQFINPFRILHKLINSIFFAGHLVSIAVTSDRVPWLNPIATTVANTAMEGLTDLHYMMDEEHVHDHPHPHQHNQIHDKSKKPIVDIDDPEHEHNHNGIFILSEIHIIFNYLTAVWDWVTSKNSWKASKLKVFPEETLPVAPRLSESWLRYETESLIDEQKQLYKNTSPLKTLAFEKLGASIKNIKNDPLQQHNFSDQLRSQLIVAESKDQPLTQHRNKYRLFPSEPPKSQQFISSMLDDRSYLNSLSFEEKRVGLSS